MEREFERALSSLDDIFDFIGEFLETQEVREDKSYAVELVVEELYTNFVKHNIGGQERIWIRLEREGECISIQLKDFSVQAFQPKDDNVLDPRQSLCDRSVGGLGLPLVHEAVDQLLYEHDAGVLCVMATISLEDSDV